MSTRMMLRCWIAVAVFFLAMPALAQPRMRSPEERANELKTALDLTVIQTDSVRTIYEQAAADMQDAFDLAAGDRTAMRELMMKIRNETDGRIEALLTPEQKEKFDKFKQERQARRPRGPGGPDRMPR